jgi:chromosome segregation ATPase
MADPYYLGQREVATGITELRSLLDNRADILSDARGGNPEIFSAIGVRMSDQLQTIRSLLRDIAATIDQVHANRTQFRVSDSELATRQNFVVQSKREIDEIESQMQAQTASQKHHFHSFTPVAPPAPFDGPSQAQLQIYQEEQIDRIAETVQIQKHIGKEIVREFDEQHELMLRLDEDMESATSAMRKVTQQITQLIDNEGRAPTYIVAVLSIVLIFMLWWVA